MKKLASKGLLMSTLICGNVLWGGTTVLANEVQEYDLDAVVVTATRTMKQIQEVPSSVSVVTAKEIEDRNVTSVQEALQYMPGVYMDQTAQGGISLRGFGSTNVLVLVDGVQMNDTYQGAVNFNSIPVENIERIEVVRGAGSSIYGGHAVGGVINITTKEAKAGTHIDAAVSYGSYKTWKKSMNVNAKINDKWSFGLGFENRKADGFDGYYNTAVAKASATPGKYNANLPTLSDGSYVYGGRGTTDWDHKTYTANVKYNFDDSKSLKYSYTKYKTYFGYKNPYSFVKDENGNPVYSGTVTTQHGNVITLKASSFYGYNNINERDTHALVYKDEDNKFNASFSYLNDKKSGFTNASVPATYTGIDWDGAGGYSSHPGKIYNFNMEKAWENVGKHTIVVGANFKQEEMVQDRYTLKHWKDENSKDQYYAHDKGKVQNFALFVQDEYKMSDPVTMYLGARLDYYKKCEGVFWNTTTPLNATSPSETHVEISPKIAFDYKADDKTNYFVSYGHSFNPPAMYKMYRYSEYTRYWYLPNPDLKPETSDTFELGMKKELDKDTNFNVTLYHVKTDDKIAASGILPGETYMGKGVKKYLNFDSEKRNGVEFELTHKISDKFYTYINYAWQQGKLKLGGKESTNFDIPKHLLHAGIEYNYDKWNALLDCQYVSARQAPDDETGEYGAEDAYFIINTAVNYKIAKNATLQFGVTNLLDREFYSGDATGGRTYNVGLRYSF